MTTVFTTPVIRHFLVVIARIFLFLKGWKVVGEPPKEKKYIFIAAPHTSNWDFIFMLCIALTKNIDVRWMGKEQLFPKPFKSLMVWLGGISIARSTTNNTVTEMVKRFKAADKLSLLITPEGTRSKVEKWKTGFYHIALEAKVPIFRGFIDAPSKTCGIVDKFIPTGRIEEDMEKIKKFYRTKTGINPKLGLDKSA
ncbi:MAG: glycerol acyltransferase [Cellvibrionales bacterium]|jgi:1-acyl-sn-glycerol-3-phosphate acyltransferase|nr:glycerol acyltransferase [Cellvibrionales bacterium]